MSTSTAVQTRKNIMEGSSPQLHARLIPCNGKKYIFELGGSCEDGDLCYVDKDATRVLLSFLYRGLLIGSTKTISEYWATVHQLEYQVYTAEPSTSQFVDISRTSYGVIDRYSYS